MHLAYLQFSQKYGGVLSFCPALYVGTCRDEDYTFAEDAIVMHSVVSLLEQIPVQQRTWRLHRIDRTDTAFFRMIFSRPSCEEALEVLGRGPEYLAAEHSLPFISTLLAAGYYLRAGDDNVFERKSVRKLLETASEWLQRFQLGGIRALSHLSDKVKLIRASEFSSHNDFCANT